MRLAVDGKFFLRSGARIFINAVTYGPFPEQGDDAWHDTELARIGKAGFNAIRIYEEPTSGLMAAAERHRIMVFAGMYWSWDRIFRGEGESFFIEAKLKIIDFFKKWGDSPALVGYFVANEISSDIARWMGPREVKESIEELIDLVHEVAPEVLAAYANYPSSEYLEPENADFTGFNIYLEDEREFRKYLARLHHLAGDRPVLLSELGLDSQAGGEERQAEILRWSRIAALECGMAGTTVFAWSDRWRVGAREVVDWDFGLTRRDGSAKPSLVALQQLVPETISLLEAKPSMPLISVIICVYNGVDRIWKAIESLKDVNYLNYEVIVVDDGSDDGTQECVTQYLGEMENLRLIRAQHGGLSKARNLGAAEAKGEIFAYTDDDCEVDKDWLFWIAKGYAELGVDAMGGPNIPPIPLDENEAVVSAAPGAPSHVMLSDRVAEHIPGCNLTVKREAFESIGGFHETYRVAGDDVDFCWRLEMAGFKIGFHGAAFVWHRRRTTMYRYFRQQKGYGKAEALLMRDHPEKFTRGHGAIWKGCVYTGASLGAHEGSFIYSGAAGGGAFQQLGTHMMPLRRIHYLFSQPSALRKLAMAELLQPQVRRWARWYYSLKWRKHIKKSTLKQTKQKPQQIEDYSEINLEVWQGDTRYQAIEKLLEYGWDADHGYSEWDLMRGEARLLLALEKTGRERWNLKLRVNQAGRPELAAVRKLVTTL